MAQDQSVIPLDADAESFCVCTPSATSDNTAKDLQKCDDSQSSTPSPGHIFIIRSRTEGKVITFLNGKIILDTPGGLGIYKWRCVQKNGWLGFQDPASAKYLGYDDAEWLQCVADKQDKREYMCPRKRAEGGYVLLALLGDQLYPLGVRSNQTVESLELKVKVRDWDMEGIAWDFIAV